QHWLDQKNETLTGGGRFSYHVGFSGMAQTMHGYDDHLARHQHEIIKRFSREVSEKLVKFLAEHQAEQLVLTAESKVLGELRAQLPAELRKKIRFHEVNVNLTNLSPVALHQHLAKLGLLPARNPPANVQGESFARSGQWRRRSAPAEGREVPITGEAAGE
ncbi:hypothetical protein EBR21_05485, partial [bacterium]|nr:hypothetical protein [bacterium]